MLVFDYVPVSPNEATLNDPCGPYKPQVITTSTSGDLMSPNYPLSYSNNANCQWIITSEDDGLMQITIIEFDLEDGYTNYKLI